MAATYAELDPATIIGGDHFGQSYTLKSGGVATNLTGYGLEVVVVSDGIVRAEAAGQITGAAAGTFRFDLAAEKTRGLVGYDRLEIRIRLTDTLGRKETFAVIPLTVRR